MLIRCSIHLCHGKVEWLRDVITVGASLRLLCLCQRHRFSILVLCTGEEKNTLSSLITGPEAALVLSVSQWQPWSQLLCFLTLPFSSIRTYGLSIWRGWWSSWLAVCLPVHFLIDAGRLEGSCDKNSFFFLTQTKPV